MALNRRQALIAAGSTTALSWISSPSAQAAAATLLDHTRFFQLKGWAEDHSKAWGFGPLSDLYVWNPRDKSAIVFTERAAAYPPPEVSHLELPYRTVEAMTEADIRDPYDREWLCQRLRSVDNYLEHQKKPSARLTELKPLLERVSYVELQRAPDGHEELRKLLFTTPDGDKSGGQIFIVDLIKVGKRTHVIVNGIDLTQRLEDARASQDINAIFTFTLTALWMMPTGAWVHRLPPRQKSFIVLVEAVMRLILYSASTAFFFSAWEVRDLENAIRAATSVNVSDWPVFP